MWGFYCLQVFQVFHSYQIHLNQGGSLFHQQGKGKPCPYMLATLNQGGLSVSGVSGVTDTI